MKFGENINYLWKVKKLSLITLLFCCAFSVKPQNIILNGSFELNNSMECINNLSFNEYDTTVQYSHDYSINDITLALMKGSCLVCLPSTYWGGGVQEGNYMLIIAGKEETLPDGSIYKKQGKISLKLNVPLSNNQNYKLSFWIKKPPPDSCLIVKNNYISVGISNTDNAFGTHLITSPYGDSIWQQYSIVFNTQMAEEYVTVKVGVNDTIDREVIVDNFVLVETTEQPNAIYEQYSNKQLVKIVDILGKESQPKKGLLFYIYSDGTVEKKIIVQ